MVLSPCSASMGSRVARPRCSSMRWGSDDRASTPPSGTSGSSIARRRVAMGWANVLRISTRFEAARVLSTGCVVETADQPCLGVSSIYEFGASRPDLKEISALLARSLRGAIAGRVRDAQREGDVAAGLDPEAVAGFLIANIAGIRVAGRGGADGAALSGLADMTLRALR